MTPWETSDQPRLDVIRANCDGEQATYIIMDPTQLQPSAGPSKITRQTVVLPSEPEEPAPILTNDVVVSQWPQTAGFQGFWGWIKRRCERIKGKSILRDDYSGNSTVCGVRLCPEKSQQSDETGRQVMAGPVGGHDEMGQRGAPRPASCSAVRKSSLSQVHCTGRAGEPQCR